MLFQGLLVTLVPGPAVDDAPVVAVDAVGTRQAVGPAALVPKN